ncbi:MAG TPA: DUF2267 domain-containing protein [Labilithrix sp.]|jgi:uncharacterized protein (DUF2267 family)|nr:DUF2267 domain-containing protein [Labilithrix sp.]
MASLISSATLVERVIHDGLPDAISAKLAVMATLRVLGESLTEDEARALTAALASDLADIVTRSEYETDFDSAEFYERARRRMNVAPVAAREGVDIVMRSLGDMLDDTLRVRLARALPHPVGERLFRSSFGEPPPHPAPIRAASHATLASGKPGSRHPLSEAAPKAAQTHSVALSEEPHRDTKLSSSEGLTQERLDDSLAKGRPPAAQRSIANARDK